MKNDFSYIGLKPVNGKSLAISYLILIILILLKNPLISCTNTNSPFYDKVLNDFDTTSYFIAVDIKSPSYKGRTIIENNDLYLFLHKTKGFDTVKYRSYIKRVLSHHRALKVGEKDFATSKFIKVYESESVIQVANSGKNNFIAYYFNGKALKDGILEKEQNAIINQLFYWEIPARIDKLTGYLMIG